jgi:hypothetical protein
MCITALCRCDKGDIIHGLAGPRAFASENTAQEAFMKLVLAAALAAGGLVATAQASSAMTLAPQAPAASSLVQDAAYGCGPGWHPNPWGRCVPNARYYRPPVYIYRPPVYYHRPYYGYGGYGYYRWHRW